MLLLGNIVTMEEAWAATSAGELADLAPTPTGNILLLQLELCYAKLAGGSWDENSLTGQIQRHAERALSVSKTILWSTFNQ